MRFIVNVRYNSCQPVPLEVECLSTVLTLKEKISIRYQLPADEIRIIFQGRELSNDVTFEQCDLGNYSCVHAVRHSAPVQLRQRQPPIPEPQGLNSIGEVVPNTSPQSPGGLYRVRFHVYCTRVCHDVQPGKLRVRCTKCKQGTLTVFQGPNEWGDVLTPGRIHGECQSQGCDGSVAEFYFKCAVHPSMDDSAPVLDLVRANSLEVPCAACTDIVSPVLVFPCATGHALCLDCFRTYCITKLNSRAFTHLDDIGYSLECPAGCDNSCVRNPHHFRILGDEQYARYQRIAAEEYVLRNGGVLCPSPGCGAGLLPEGGDSKVVCERQGTLGCGFEFCRYCHEEYHSGDCRTSLLNAISAGSQDDYRLDPENAIRAEWEKQSRLTVIQTTKPCPKCNAPTEKSGGCMHMKCALCCFQWCWICCKEWNRNCQADHWFG
ncbi:E3 ubiquitin-protein ligase parkin [Lamellibrachia satsuma]|nr:E3 ubiquitin-protein ligase parkin [Lamellibrachia satsuma]